MSRQRARASREANPEKARATSRKYASTHADMAKARAAKWYADNKERALASNKARRLAHPEQARIAQSKYARENPEKRMILEQRRRAAKARCDGNVSIAEWLEIKEAFGNACGYCLKTDRELTMDHVQALSQGGLHAACNIVPACMACNGRKRAKGILHMLEARS